MGRGVLVPVDNSDPATNALEFALEEYPDSPIIALHVVNPQLTYLPSMPEFGSITTTAPEEDEAKRAAERAAMVLEEAFEEANVPENEVTTDFVVGEAARSITEYAEEYDVEKIVMGSHGRSGLGRIMLGSVAERVIRQSPVTVTVVR